MKKNTRKSTALISMVLVPLGLAGLGFNQGCDDGGSSSTTVSEGDYGAPDDAALKPIGDFTEEGDVFNLDPVKPTGVGPVASATGPTGPIGPTTWPTTQPLAQSAFASQSSHGSTRHHYSSGGFFFLPIPFRAGYRPAFRGYAPPIYRPNVPRPINRTGGGGSGYSGGSGFSRSTGSGSSGVSRSTGTSRGGFGSSGSSYSGSSS